MTPTARALSAPVPVAFEGATLKVAPYTLDVQAAFEQYLVGRAYDGLRAQRAALADEYPDERAALRRDVDAGEYDFGSDLCRRALRLDRHLKHLVYLCLCAGHRDDPRAGIDPALVDRMFADPDAARKVVEAMYEANRDPNGPAPGEPGPPGPAP